MAELPQIIWLVLPLAFGGLVHGLIMKFNVLAGLTRPIDGGRTLRGVRWFGDNKTWRGVVAMGFGTGAGFGILWSIPALGDTRSALFGELSTLALVGVGMAVGAAGMLAELPNSFAKRRLGIASGAPAKGLTFWLFYVVDQIDLVAGFWAALCLWVPPSASRIALSLGLVFVGHQLVTVIGYALGMRKTWR